MTKTLIEFAILISCSVRAKLLIKTDANAVPEQRFLLGIPGWRNLLGIGLLAVS